MTPCRRSPSHLTTNGPPLSHLKSKPTCCIIPSGLIERGELKSSLVDVATVESVVVQLTRDEEDLHQVGCWLCHVTLPDGRLIPAPTHTRTPTTPGVDRGDGRLLAAQDELRCALQGLLLLLRQQAAHEPPGLGTVRVLCVVWSCPTADATSTQTRPLSLTSHTRTTKRILSSARMFRERYQLVQQRVLRHELFTRPILGHDRQVRSLLCWCWCWCDTNDPSISAHLSTTIPPSTIPNSNSG